MQRCGRNARGVSQISCLLLPARPVILSALASVFLVIALGFVARRFLVRDERMWDGFERVSYFVLLPALIIKTLAGADLGSVPYLRLAAAMLGALALVGGAMVLAGPTLRRVLMLDGPGFSSLLQGVLRWNAFVALAVAGNLFGAEGVTLAAVAIAALLPPLNIASVVALRHYAGGEGSLSRGLLTNPFLVGTLIGIALNLSALPLPKEALAALDIVARGALGAGLLLVGAGLRLGDLARPSRGLLAATLLRLVLLPVLGGILARALGLTGAELGIVVLALGVPSAAAGYILARQMGGDAPLMAAILSLQTLLAAATLPLLLLVFLG